MAPMHCLHLHDTLGKVVLTADGAYAPPMVSRLVIDFGGDNGTLNIRFLLLLLWILNHPCRPLPPEYPPPNYMMAFRIQTEGVPLLGHFTTPRAATVLRDRYDNHPAVGQNTAEVHKKFAKEEWNSYHVHFLRFLYVFIYGIVINPIQWVFQKGKGRICIDCTNGPGDAAGSANTHIPKPSIERADECPPVYFQTAMDRLLR
eukprot:scaffold3407_cov100-Cylindrotheca_fusiformis.AAC.2